MEPNDKLILTYSLNIQLLPTTAIDIIV